MLEIREISKSSDEEIFLQLEGLIEDMYTYMNGTGLLIPLAEGGAHSLTKSIRNTLGLITFLPGAFVENRLVGFGIGVLKILPPYLGGGKVCTIAHLYISPEQRGAGIGKQLLTHIEQWAETKKVSSMEMDVLYQNENGIRFWQSCGYTFELIKMRKF